MYLQPLSFKIQQLEKQFCGRCANLSPRLEKRGIWIPPSPQWFPENKNYHLYWLFLNYLLRIEPGQWRFKIHGGVKVFLKTAFHFSILYPGGLPGVSVLDKAHMLDTELGALLPLGTRATVHYHKKSWLLKASSRMPDFLFVHVDEEPCSGKS